jgi:hypothetical protein
MRREISVGTAEDFRRSVDRGIEDQRAHRELRGVVARREVAWPDVTLQVRLVTNRQFAYELGYMMAEREASADDYKEVIPIKFENWKNAIGIEIQVMRLAPDLGDGTVWVSLNQSADEAQPVDVRFGQDIVAYIHLLMFTPATIADNGGAVVRFSYSGEASEIMLEVSN